MLYTQTPIATKATESHYTVDCKTVRIFAYSSTREQSNKRSRTRLKTENETRVCEDRALRARKTLSARFIDFFTDFEKKKTDCFIGDQITKHAYFGGMD